MTDNPFAFSDAQPPATPPAAPAAQPQPQQQAAPQPPPAAPAPAAPPAPAGEDPFSGPAPQAPRGPRLREMYGRLLLVLPHKLEEGIPNRLGKPGDVQDRMTADVIILDGGPCEYGGKPEKTPPVPHDKVAQIPHKNERMYISSAGLISQCREALAKRLAGQPGMVLGRLARGEAKGQQEAPWLLTPPTDQDKQVARGYLATVDPFA